MLDWAVESCTFHLSLEVDAACTAHYNRDAVATGMVRDEARGGAPKASASQLSSPSPSQPETARPNGKIATRPLKEIVRKLPPDHPLRVVVLGEPDEIDGDECFVKLTVWLRLLPEK